MSFKISRVGGPVKYRRLHYDPIIVTPEKRRQLLKMYNSGVKIKEIQVELGINGNKMYSLLREMQDPKLINRKQEKKQMTEEIV